MNRKTKYFIGLGGIAVLSGAIFFVLYSFFHSENALRDWKEIKDEGVIHIVTEYNSIGYYVSGDTVAGTQYDLCKYIEERSGLQVFIRLENNLETAIDKLNRNIYDVIALNIPITSQSRAELAFTMPIVKSKQVLIQRKSAESDTIQLIRNQLHLAGKTIYVPQNSPVILRLQNLSEEIADPIHIAESIEYTQEELLYRVAYGSIDYAVVDQEIANKNKKNFPNIDSETDISFTQLQAWAVRQSSPVLLDSLNVWMVGYLQY
jgi:membrane-bound lytic murein transglycosylase MltF